MDVCLIYTTHGIKNTGLECIKWFASIFFGTFNDS